MNNPLSNSASCTQTVASKHHFPKKGQWLLHAHECKWKRGSLNIRSDQKTKKLGGSHEKNTGGNSLVVQWLWLHSHCQGPRFSLLRSHKLCSVAKTERCFFFKKKKGHWSQLKEVSICHYELINETSIIKKK